MDMQKIGSFLAQLRKEQNLTQDELGEKIGVTNKTVSRWENGNYLPPVEMLQLLSKLYDVSINELLSGERLNDDNYKTSAEKNLLQTLENSAFSAKEKKQTLAKKWKKSHCVEMIFEMLILIAAVVLCTLYCKEAFFAVVIVSFVWVGWLNNRMTNYIESHLYNEQNTNKNDPNNK